MVSPPLYPDMSRAFFLLPFTKQWNRFGAWEDERHRVRLRVRLHR